MAHSIAGAPVALTGLRVYKGTYVLVMEVSSPLQLVVGKLGTFDFPVGWYAYAGSARGPGGLAARLRHHLHGAARPHWHVDYLRRGACLAEIWYGRAPDHDEHRWAACLAAMRGIDSVAAGFGSTDCRCATHLIFFSARPNVAPFRRKVRSLQGKGRGAIYRISVGGN